ncbi:MAG TPA: ATP-binding cassette domain-containing protein, partial [Chroococcales cyanobacterium]
MIAVDNISKTYGGNQVLSPTTHTFKADLTTALIGPSGCGKSTLLRIILGLIVPDTGTVTFGGEPITPRNLQSVRHKIGYVVQDGGLFPHLTAQDNVTLLSRVLKRSDSEIKQRVAELADLVQLSSDALSRFPANMSGGQKQRVGIMRALMLNPQVILLDEPLSALDPITRNELQNELKNIFSKLRKTVIIVTHDMHEAAHFGDEILLMRAG